MANLLNLGKIKEGHLRGFKVKLSCMFVYRVFAYLLLKSFLDATFEGFPIRRFGVRLEARVALDRAIYAWDDWPEDWK